MIIKALSYVVPRKKRKTFNPQRGLAYDVHGETLVVDQVTQAGSGVHVTLIPVESFKR